MQHQTVFSEKMTGIKEIARIAGVSIGTVDRVLHNRGRVSEETREKILEIVAKHNYKPNLLARSLKKGEKKTIAILVPDPIEDEYWQQAWEGFESQLHKTEHQGIFAKPFFYSLKNQQLFSKQAQQIIEMKPDGLIMAPNFLEEGKKLFAQCKASSIPVVLFDNFLPGTDPFCFIGTNSFRSGMLAAQLLDMISDSDGKFAIFHFDELLSNSPHMIEKERGFIAYLKENCPGREYFSIVTDSTNNYKDKFDDIFNGTQISGVFVSTSKTWLIGSYLNEKGLKNIRLVGFDLIKNNIGLMKSGHIDFLINQNPRRQARKSLNAFVNAMVFKEEVVAEELFPIEIITRNNLDSYL